MNTDPPPELFLVVDQNGAWVADAFSRRATAEQEAKAQDTDKLTHAVHRYVLATPKEEDWF